MTTAQTPNQGLPTLEAPWTLAELQPYLMQLVTRLETQIVQRFKDVADFNARVTQPEDWMLVGLTDPGTLNVYLNGKLNQVWPALPAYQYGTEPPTHDAPYGTMYVQVT